ncbi:polysaccharide lyase family 14 [Pyrrhoderma noxium]|uniref:Polysaccharide lyase family 14 n=1 Tax=Pyrrhoderma noxium TaxID=2282107 RepID=A0A286U6L6_9AGAM|nr:polysaccharide lyase family 14 [Pyrrhoderma noxium]
MTYSPKLIGNSPLLYCLAFQVLASITTNARTFVAYGANEDIATQLGLTTSTVLPFPSQTMSSSDANNYLKGKWALQGGVSFGEDRLAFVSDPVGGGSGSGSDSGSKSGSSVLSVEYPSGSYSHGTGGAQFYSTFGDKEGFEAMLLSYDIAFESDFDWNKGGKLPGLRGGPVLNSCSGGREPSGDDCFSSRLMWRKNGEGEGIYKFFIPIYYG